MRCEPPQGWTRGRLGDHIDLLPGFAFKSAQFTDEPSDIRLLRGDNVGQGRLRWSNVRKWPRDGRSAFARYELREGDVVLAMDRPWIEAGLKHAVVRKEDLPALLVQRVARIRATSALAQRYLAYVIGSPNFTSYVRAVETGTAVPHISGGQIAAFPVRLPPIEEQVRIAELLGSLDDKIDSDRRLASLLEKTATALFRARFVDFVGVEDFEQGEVGPIPRGWRVASVYDVAAVKYGAAFKSALFSESDGVPLIRIRDLPESNPSVRTTESRADAKLIRRGDIVVGMDGEFKAFPWHGPDSWLNQRVCCFEPLPGVSRVFLLESIRKPLAFLEATKGGTTVIHLGKSDIDTFRFVRPTAEAMAEFALHVDPLYEMAVALRSETRRLAEIRDDLLPRLVSGEIRVPGTTDPEEVIGPAAGQLAGAKT